MFLKTTIDTRRYSALFRQMFSPLLALILVSLAPPGFSEEPGAPADPAIEVTGKVTVLHIDDFAHRRGEYRYILEDKLTNRRFKLEFEGEPPKGLTTGATVKVRGKARGQVIVVGANDGSSLKTVEVAAATTSGVQNTIVLVADFQDSNVSCSVAAIQDLMFTDPNDTSLDDFYQTNSLGQVSYRIRSIIRALARAITTPGRALPRQRPRKTAST